MPAQIVAFPSGGTPGQSRKSGAKSAAPAGQVVEIVRFDRALRQKKDTLERLRTGASSASLPIIPDLAHGIDRRCGSIEREPLLFPPAPQRVIRLESHIGTRKLITYTLTSPCKDVTGSFVSAIVLQFHPMGDDPNRIRELRTAAGISQQELGNRAGCSKMTISDLERGKMELTLTYMRRIAPALGVHVADLLPSSENPWALNADERRYLDRYRHADDDQRLTLDRVTDAVASTKDAGSRAA